MMQFLGMFGVGTTVIVGLGGWVSGRLSVACLRRAPDFPHKTEMIWGAKWGWLLFLGGVALLYLAVCLGVNFGFYPSTLAAAVGALLFSAPIVTISFFPWQHIGSAAWVYRIKERIRRRPTDRDNLVVRRERVRGSSWWSFQVGISVMLIFGPAGWYISRNFPTEHLAR